MDKMGGSAAPAGDSGHEGSGNVLAGWPTCGRGIGSRAERADATDFTDGGGSGVAPSGGTRSGTGLRPNNGATPMLTYVVGARSVEPHTHGCRDAYVVAKLGRG